MPRNPPTLRPSGAEATADPAAADDLLRRYDRSRFDRYQASLRVPLSRRLLRRTLDVAWQRGGPAIRLAKRLRQGRARPFVEPVLGPLARFVKARTGQ